MQNEFRKDTVIKPVYTESAGEYILPDYKGDVKKILLSNARVVPGGKFPADGNVEFIGTVLYEIVYLDGENKLSRVEFTTDFSLQTKYAGESYRDAFSATRVENFSLRLMGPRKFSAKASLESTVHVITDEVICTEGDTFDSREPEKDVQRISVMRVNCAETMEREYAEELTKIDGVIEDDVEILSVHTEPVITDVQLSAGGAYLSGEIAVTVLLSRECELPYVESTKISFKEHMELDEAAEGAHPCAHMYVTSAKCSLNPTDDGVSLTVSLITETELYVMSGSALEICTDCYLTDCDTANEYESFEYSEFLGGTEDSFEDRAEIVTSSVTDETLRNVLYATAMANVEETHIGATGVTVKGKVKYKCIACDINEDGTASYFPLKFETDYEHNVNIGCRIDNKCDAECYVEVTNTHIENDSEKLYAYSDVKVRATLTERRNVRRVCASSISDTSVAKDESVVTVYYPKASDTLFEIAKKYHTTVMDIASLNRLSESTFSEGSRGSLQGVRRLIIK